MLLVGGVEREMPLSSPLTQSPGFAFGLVAAVLYWCALHTGAKIEGFIHFNQKTKRIQSLIRLYYWLSSSFKVMMGFR